MTEIDKNNTEMIKSIIKTHELDLSVDLINEIEEILRNAEIDPEINEKFYLNRINLLSEDDSLFISTDIKLPEKKSILFIKGDNSTGKTTFF